MRRESRAAEATQWLMQLETFKTFSPFSRVFYRLVCRWLQGETKADRRLQTALILLLRIEIRRHQAVQEIARAGKLDLSKLVDISLVIRNPLQRLARAVAGLETDTRTQKIVQHLLLAESRYHLGRTAEVVAHLRHAIDLGCRHPVVQFALGYNLYSHAVRTYLPFGPDGAPRKPLDRDGFETACRQAIRAFRAGIEGQPFDAQIHWWIGLIAEILDAREEARSAFQSAGDIDPDTFGEPALKKIRSLAYPVPDAITREESARLQNLPEIAKSDLDEASTLLGKLRELPEDWLTPRE